MRGGKGHNGLTKPVYNRGALNRSGQATSIIEGVPQSSACPANRAEKTTLSGPHPCRGTGVSGRALGKKRRGPKTSLFVSGFSRGITSLYIKMAVARGFPRFR